MQNTFIVSVLTIFGPLSLFLAEGKGTVKIWSTCSTVPDISQRWGHYLALFVMHTALSSIERQDLDIA
jgi:hypothetical protein